ncbi:hypothetical protein AG1IA_05962 [Rhizoctonia solani AG-1 IA]|uniref:Uncharacterized protein n=1 Tax=Thanatephorus cucumeris (strain AG1-IA) TaxID=983506 RepID=L8WPS7_THACA|nr:hypothetical protein AG1IA_05962 [Rhizoctonia solani AG-1 IA]
MENQSSYKRGNSRRYTTSNMIDPQKTLKGAQDNDHQITIGFRPKNTNENLTIATESKQLNKKVSGTATGLPIQGGATNKNPFANSANFFKVLYSVCPKRLDRLVTCPDTSGQRSWDSSGVFQTTKRKDFPVQLLLKANASHQVIKGYDLKLVSSTRKGGPIQTVESPNIVLIEG